MMGDNRDNSTDSRASWGVGYVPFENLIGRAEIIFFSAAVDEPGRLPMVEPMGRGRSTSGGTGFSSSCARTFARRGFASAWPSAFCSL